MTKLLGVLRAGRGTVALVCAALCFLVAAVYHRVGGFTFVFDDTGFLHDNPAVRAGLTGAGLRWALTTFATGNWHPLTWLSHMLDVQLFGLRPGPHHLVNAVLHALNTVLLFLVLRRLTAAFWSCAFVAALFAVHPLHVESVAWISERKDLLSGLFWIAAIGAYARYAEHPGLRRYLLVTVIFLCGLMAKPMVVTLPVVLLLLDWWPLGRLAPSGAAGRRWGALVAEKMPLLALAATVGFVTSRAQASVGAFASDIVYRLSWRIANAVTSNAVYLGKVFWPTGLAAYYPFQLGGRPPWQVAGALLLLVGVSAAVIAARRRCPAAAVGWFWYLVTLSPVIGLVQVGGQARADRYMYLPLIGLGVAVAWCAPLRHGARAARATLTAVAFGALGALCVAAVLQSETWRTPLSLYGRMLEVTSGNWVAHNGYAAELAKQGRAREAAGHLRAAVALNPGAMALRRSLGFALDDAGLADEAIVQLGIFTRMSPGDAEALFRLGLLLGQAGRFAESLPALREATRLRPWFPPGWDALGVTCLNMGLPADAEAAFREVLRIDPANELARRKLEAAQAQETMIFSPLTNRRKAPLQRAKSEDPAAER